ncbi:MAG: PAS domain S-box protein [Actinomycetia bacterium]|nr:PAS domain S-box protein [Actinomycetes bacterium]MCP4226211.1 PAS domain S-box protein [Actinomycetes bacterium]MCP5034149.1 PAS domain S-box protein [Actinomycetes bacterium]
MTVDAADLPHLMVADHYLEAAPDAILVVDFDGVIVMANERCRDQLGYSGEELIGQAVELLVPDARRGVHINHRGGFGQLPRPRNMGDPTARLEAQTASGELVPVDIALSPVTIDGHDLVMVVVRDVSERVAAEAELEANRQEADRRLRISEAAFRSAFDDAAVPMAILDISDPATQTIVRANEALATLLGRSTEELAGNSSVELTHPEDREQNTGQARALLHGQPSYQTELRYRRADGSHLWAVVNTSRLAPTGEASQSLVHIIDITRQVAAEQERDQREELLVALAAIRKASLDELPIDEVTQLIVTAVGNVLAVDLAFVATPNHSGSLQVRTTHEIRERNWFETVLSADSVAGRVMKTSEIEVVPAPAGLGRVLPVGKRPGWAERLVGPIVVLPLRTANSVEGILAIVRGSDDPPFSEHDLTVAQSLAAEAAVSLVLSRARADRRRMLLVEDRERIARDLHDVVIQRLYAAGMRLQASIGRPELLADRAGEAVVELDDTIDSVRNSIFQLGQPDDTVAGELRRLIDRHRASGRSHLVLEIDGEIESLSSVVVNHLLPTVNELLSNVERHAQASNASVLVSVDDNQLTVVVVDDGIGLRPGMAQGFGLRNLTKRAMSLGGSLDYGEGSGAGCEFRWAVPLD